MWHKYWRQGMNGTTQLYGLIYHNNTKFYMVAKKGHKI